MGAGVVAQPLQHLHLWCVADSLPVVLRWLRVRPTQVLRLRPPRG
jgi:hypothetical protein